MSSARFSDADREADERWRERLEDRHILRQHGSFEEARAKLGPPDAQVLGYHRDAALCNFQYPFLRCYRERGHDGMHRTEGGTEFSSSGKVGMGKIGVDYRAPVTTPDEPNDTTGREATWPVDMARCAGCGLEYFRSERYPTRCVGCDLGAQASVKVGEPGWRERMSRKPLPFRERLIEFLAAQPDVKVAIGAYDDIDLGRFVAKMLEYDA